MEKLSVTVAPWGPCMGTPAGWETTVCLKDLHVLLHAILLLPLNVLMEKLFVTWGPMLGVGWETTVCLKDLCVLLHAILLLLLNVLMET